MESSSDEEEEEMIDLVSDGEVEESEPEDEDAMDMS